MELLANRLEQVAKLIHLVELEEVAWRRGGQSGACLLYTSDAADERSSVDLGGRRIIKKKKRNEYSGRQRQTD